MRFAKAAFLLATAFVVVGGYFQERARLRRIQQLPPERARAVFELAERRRERTMWLVMAALVLGAGAAFAARALR